MNSIFPLPDCFILYVKVDLITQVMYTLVCFIVHGVGLDLCWSWFWYLWDDRRNCWSNNDCHIINILYLWDDRRNCWSNNDFRIINILYLWDDRRNCSSNIDFRIINILYLWDDRRNCWSNNDFRIINILYLWNDRRNCWSNNSFRKINILKIVFIVMFDITTIQSFFFSVWK